MSSILPTPDQLADAKYQTGGALLLFHLGYHYKAIGADAVILSQSCGLTIIRTPENNQAAFPIHQLDAYLAKLVSLGHRVAICDIEEITEILPPTFDSPCVTVHR